MLLEPLVSTIETIKARIATHGASLRQNETRTRAALIDPLLQALGWDTTDPALVTPEYRTGGWADYALIGPGNRPVAIIEAKRLGSVVENHLEQAVGYCIQEGIAYAGVTDGSHWQLYRTFEPVPLVEKLVLDVSIANTPPYEASLKLLLLWSANLASGRPLAANEPLLVGHLDDPPVAPDPPSPTPDPDGTENWISLSNVDAGKGNLAPSGIRFSEREPREIKSWSQILVQVAERLSNDGVLRAVDCPIAGLGFINSSATGTGGGTSGRFAEVSGGLYVNVNWRAVNIIKHSRRLLTYFNVDPATVELRFE